MIAILLVSYFAIGFVCAVIMYDIHDGAINALEAVWLGAIWPVIVIGTCLAIADDLL